MTDDAWFGLTPGPYQHFAQARLRAIEQALKTQGFLSHGLASDGIPSRAGHGADRINELFTRSQMVGDEEQYAAAMALMARSLNYPARVVMGFAPDVPEDAGTVKITPEVTEPPAEPPVCTMLFSRMPPPPSARSTAMDTTADGMADAIVMPANSPR